MKELIQPEHPSSEARMRRSQVAEQIKALILKRGFRPGDALPTETELCQDLGVSRSSVREAIRSLATLDVVEVRHGSGTVVGQMSLKPLVETLVFRGVLSPGDDLAALREVVELRQMIDLSLAERIIEAHQGRDNSSLAHLVERMIEAADAERPFLQEDRQFHFELLAPVKNDLAQQLVAAFWDIHSAVLPRVGLALPDDMRRTAAVHGDLLRAALEGDVAAYRTAVVSHYEPLLRMLSGTTR